LTKVLSLYQSSIGKKFIMAVTGMIGFGFVVMHMVGNLQVFLGPEKLDEYAVMLRSTGGLLYIARLTLIGAVVLHIFAAYQLTTMSHRSRAVNYHRWQASGSDYASRTMRWSGPILLIFIVYHLLDFTFGTVNPGYQPGQVGRNLIASFQLWYVSLFYIIGNLALGFHMYHGVWSMFQTLGANNSKYNRPLHALSIVSTLVVVLGNISIPLAVLFKLVK
jgi:succinate dehydrogenase / fumarate reductase, cytochrome b subunit